MRRLTNWLRRLLFRWLCSELDARITDLERHFITKRDEKGNVTQTLADVPIGDRKHLANRPLRGASWAQAKGWLEATDGGRMVSNG
jgi:hypothetical protein